MSDITFLASSKPFILPKEIDDCNNKTYFEKEEDWAELYVHKAERKDWGEILDLLTLPYKYEVVGVDSFLFGLYLEKYMEVGEVLELLYLPNQHYYKSEYEKLLKQPSPIFINIGSLTYKDESGTYQLSRKSWVEELSHKNILTKHGITTIVKY